MDSKEQRAVVWKSSLKVNAELEKFTTDSPNVQYYTSLVAVPTNADEDKRLSLVWRSSRPVTPYSFFRMSNFRSVLSCRTEVVWSNELERSRRTSETRRKC